MMDKIFKNERTMASAGTGKTFALTNRYIALVLGGAKPEEICALTFTRKAAGEFFSKTITKLAHAASSDAAAADLASHIKKIAPALKTATRADFEKALEQFVKASPRLRLETIDAFTAKFVKFFSEELGISDSITVLDEFAESKIRARALMLAVQKFNSPKTLAEFAETIREANRGGDEKKILGAIENFRELAHAALIETPDPAKWSLPKTLGKVPYKEWDEKAYKRNCARLEQIICGYPDAEGGARKQMQYILRFFRESSPEKISTNITKTVDQAISIFAAKGTLAGAEFGDADSENGFKAGAEEARIIDENLAMLFAAQVGSAQAATKAIYKIISEYESVYDEIARKKGLMSFSDMAIAIDRAKDSIEREFVEYRFDSAINHWLFDEFQDTSRLQWQIFENMVSEAVLNSDGRKTFFYVGDAKQAIYAWRGGDVSLFDEILEKYRENICDNPQIKTSQRSCPAVIAAVNNIFGNAEVIKKHYGEAVAKKWAHIWQPHDVAERNLNEPGEVTLDIIDAKKLPDGEDGEDGEDDSQDAAMAKAVYDYIEKKDPISRNISCAVLTQKNSLAETIIKTINTRAAYNKKSIRAAGELDIKIAQDNLAIPPLCAMLKAAAHPADTLSLGVAKMSPLGKIFEDAEWRESLMRRISAAGFAEALKDYAKIMADCSPDKFTRLRISQFAEAARIFDMSQNRSIDDFLDFVSTYKVREGAASDTIQVMTIHKAKGLDFDMVILPQLENPKGSHIRPLHYSKDKDVFVLPGKTIRSLDGNLQAAHKYTEDEESFEKLCKFYVALTRAKSAIHIILPKVKIDTVKKSAGKRNFAYLLRDVFHADKTELCEGAACSDLNNPRWMDYGEEHKAPPPEAECNAGEAKPEEPQADAENFSREPQALPQLQKTEFSFDFLNRGTANLTGLAAHSIFENLGAKTTLQEAAKRAKILYADCPENFGAAAELVEKSLENPQIKEVFACADFAAELPYAIFENGETHAGRMDRVNFFDGRKKAEIIDFKTDAATPGQLIARHSEQLRRYARALSKMSGIQPENIELKILSTHNRELIDVKP